MALDSLPHLLALGNVIAALKVLFVLLGCYLAALTIYRRYFHPLSKLPGPFWASLTDIWYFRALRYCRESDHSYPLHNKYGKIVRVGPNHVQICDPSAIDTIYGSGKVFAKGEFYDGFISHIGPRKGHFEQRDEKIHGHRRRLVAPLYTQASMLQFEPCVDRLIAMFYNQMDTFATSGEEIDMSDWLRKFTFDVVGEIFYGRKGGFGFIRDNIDYNNWCKLMETMPPLASAIAYLPKLLRPLVFMAEMLLPSTRIGAKGFFDVIKQSHIAVAERKNERADGKHKNKNDLLNRLLDLVNDDPDPKLHWTEKDVVTEIWTVIWAGSDTTAIALTAIFYFLHKNPLTLTKLRAEIEDGFQNGTLTYPLRYADCIRLPYLHAVVREAMRLHTPLEGLSVSINPSAVHRDNDIFGDDADSFVPERWMRDGEKKAAEMDRHMMQFGYGPRVCIGKYLTMTEMYKLLPTILRDYEFVGLEDREWKVTAGWFHHQKGVNVRVRRRRPQDANAVVDVPDDMWRNE